MAQYCLSGRWRAEAFARLVECHQISDGFLGICVAASAEPAGDDYIITRLQELGLRQVRLDFSRGRQKQFTERFLKRLLSEKFRVCLHLVQPPGEAEQMAANAQARDAWRLFVAETLANYGRELELVEIGSTCNRRKWSGYSLAAFLQAWGIAREAATAQNCRLAAPNVTDFEPFYNFALLRAMKRKNIPPDFHTDNLFVERAGEPETYDPKIMGKTLAGALKFDLIRKARFLADIGAACGAPKTICSHVSWSLRRIGRFLEDIEEKQADYLARYCCLAAASGALERVYWGPLIGQREGLIDDGTSEFPEIPHAAFYGRANGAIENYRIRPAFHAFRTVNRFIAGAKYLRKIPAGRGLEIHEFLTEDGLRHAAWTINGRRALTGDCYPQTALAGAVICSRDGAMFKAPPAMLTESPVYILWPGQKNPLWNGQDSPAARLDFPSAGGTAECPAPLKKIRFACLAGRDYRFVDRDGLAGICLAGKENFILNQIALLKQSNFGGGEVLRAGRNRVWRLPADSAGNKIVIKLFRPPDLLRRRLAGKKGDKALRSWNGANELLRRGIFTPWPVAFFHAALDPLAAESWYVCDDFWESYSARNAFNAFSAGQAEFAGMAEQAFYDRIALFIRKMHDRGVYFRDLSAGNLLFKSAKDKTIELALIDTARAVFYEKKLSLPKRLCDLMRSCHPLRWKGRKVFIATYLGLIGRRYRWWINIPFYYYDLKHWIKGKLRPWRGK